MPTGDTLPTSETPNPFRPGRTFSTLSVEILYLIAGNLAPKDVLALCRTSKSIKNILTSNQSKRAWRESWGHVGVDYPIYGPDMDVPVVARAFVPSCPPGMSEPMFASLLFDKAFCMSCERRKTRQVCLILRLRLCWECCQARLQQGNGLLDQVRRELGLTGSAEIGPDRRLLTMVVSQKQQRSQFKPVQITENYDALGNAYFDPNKFLDVAREYYRLVDSKNNKKLEVFIKEKQIEISEITEHYEHITKYLNLRASYKKHADAIFSTLRKRGYNEKDFCLNWLSREDWDEFKDIIAHGSTGLKIFGRNAIIPNLMKLLDKDRMIQAEIVKKRHKHIRSLVLESLSSLIDEYGKHVDPRMFVVPTEDNSGIEELDRFFDENSDNPNYDRLTQLPAEDWHRLSQGNLLPTLWLRYLDAFAALVESLICGVTGLHVSRLRHICLTGPDVDISLLIQSCDVSLPFDFSLRHPAAFFRRVRNDKLLDNNLCSYVDVYDALSQSEATFQRLLEVMIAPHSNTALWLGDKRSMVLATTLLEQLRYTSKGSIQVFGPAREVSMGDMLDKGAIFVCQRCYPSKRRARNWKQLVQHFFIEERFIVNAVRTMLKRNIHVPLDVSHDIQLHEFTNTEVSRRPFVCELPNNPESLDNDCPFDEYHTHDFPEPGKPQYVCGLCLKLFRNYDQTFMFKWRQCVVTHILMRHGKEAEKMDILRY